MMPLFTEEIEYTVKKSDTYTSIAEKYYGDVVYRKRIMKANSYKDLLENETIIIPPLISNEELVFVKKYNEKKLKR